MMRPPASIDADAFTRREALRLSRNILDRVLVPSVDDAARLTDRVAVDLTSELLAAAPTSAVSDRHVRHIVNVALSGFIQVKLDVETIGVRGGPERIASAFADIVHGAIRHSVPGADTVLGSFGIGRVAHCLRRQLPGPVGYASLLARSEPVSAGRSHASLGRRV